MDSTLLGTDRPLAQVHDVALLDLDGVVYVGPDAVPGVPEFLASARELGLRLAFVTNNAARPPHDVADHLTELGIAAKAAEVVTSAQAAARYLADRLPGGARILVVGTTGLDVALRERGLTPITNAEGQVDAVVQGYSPELNWHLLAEGAVAINRGVLWVATNVDPTVPSPRGPLPGNGSMVAALRHATGREPIVTGKPDPTMHRESLIRSKAERPIVVGDRLDTDIEGANAVGCPSLLVFSGVTTVGDLLKATPKLRPTYVAADLRGLLVEHRQPELMPGGAACGVWSAQRTGGALALARRSDAEPPENGAMPEGTARSLTPDDLDAVRALCAAAWSDDSGGRSEDGRLQVRPADGDDAAAWVIERLGLGDSSE